MKTIFLLLFFTQASFACLLSDNSYLLEDNILLDIKVESHLITWSPCEGGGISATVQVSIYINNPLNPSVYLLAAQQVVEIPCGTVHKMTRYELDRYVLSKKTKGIPFVVDYLKEEDHDGSIFKQVASSIYKRIRTLED